MASFVLRTLPLSRLRPARYNPRKPLRTGSLAYRKLKTSIERFGLVEPLVWNARSGRLVGGHARLAVLKDLGVAKAPVAVVRLDAAAEKALNVVLNNPEAQGRFDYRKLYTVLSHLKRLGSLEESGFAEGDLRKTRLAAVERLEAVPDAGQVEITLVVPAGVYSAVEPKLDSLVREYDLESHVRGAGGSTPRRKRRR